MQKENWKNKQIISSKSLEIEIHKLYFEMFCCFGGFLISYLIMLRDGKNFRKPKALRLVKRRKVEDGWVKLENFNYCARWLK